MRNPQQTSCANYHYKDKELLSKIWCFSQSRRFVTPNVCEAVFLNLKMLTR